ncbi:ATP-binding protein [Nocardioides panaciterrulae]|uniref:Anti-sigma regulatory factor (Ser/Thr protein kinase) n=1 Tax=Nocardioides panaciterrulae TaxID=661492 RepID=A0A7Y9J9I9_9ACTN|nr:anti-sigma regulatory factor (Ser/Thr protein kinase) [Nocardioides panaciterrulae]
MQNARRWVVETCRDIDRPDLVECAELGVSELVTNALLHAVPPISVRVRGTREHPRVEVRDGSVEPPALPEALPTDSDELLLTFGRGLGIVARCADAWGAEIEDDGKVVWFAPSDHVLEQLTEGLITGVTDRTPREPHEDDVTVAILGVPLRTHLLFQHHYRELRREVRLLALAHESDYPLAKSLSDVFGSLDRELRENMGAEQIDAALLTGREHTDLHLRVRRETAGQIGRFLELLELADDFCRQQRLLSLARSPEQQQFQRWFLGEFVRQGADAAPVPWEAHSGVGS